QPIELDWGENILEQGIEVIDRHHLPARHVAEFGTVLEEDGRGEFGDEGIWEIEVHIKELQPGEHSNLHRRKDLSARHLLRVWQRRIREEVALPDGIWGHACQGSPILTRTQPAGQPGGPAARPGAVCPATFFPQGPAAASDHSGFLAADAARPSPAVWPAHPLA